MNPSPDRQIRVFVSSTFRDMGAERDHLVKFVFPQLRKLCESRGVTWGEVDLRWGVTDEEAAEGKVLPICLEEIRRCRPYFIGILGERYGWVPGTVSPELIESEPWLKEQMQGHKSVTELEILHGVLNNPAMAGHAFFYLRDPDYINHLPFGAKRSDYVSEDAASAAKLRDLKKRLAESSFPVWDRYKDVETFGHLVLDDLTGVINKLWPEGTQLDLLDREAMDHEAFAQSRARVYIGRQEYFDRLDAHASGSGDQPLVILGESGSGKSALLANWAIRYRQQSSSPLLLMHFIGGTPYSSDWAAMLRRIMGEFKRKFGIEQEIPETPNDLRGAVEDWLQIAATKGRVILILDALNQLEDRDGAPDLVWLPTVMPENVRLIVSTLPGRALEEITKRKWPVLEVEPLDAAERNKLIMDFLAQSSRRLSPARVKRIASAPQSASPLYLRVLLDELCVFGEHERLDERINHYLQAQTIPALFERVLARWEKDYSADIDLVRNTMTLLWAARRGMSEDELRDALGSENEKGERESLPRAIWSPLFLAAADSLVSRGGLLTFFHDYLREAVRESYLPAEVDQSTAHRRLADFFERQPASPRLIDELPWQLAGAKEWERLQTLLMDRECFAAAWEANPFEVKTCWTQIEARSPLRMVNAYLALIQNPEAEPDKDHLGRLSSLLADTGHPEEALRLRSALVEHFKSAGEQHHLLGALGDQANLLVATGDWDGALTLYKEKKQLCLDSIDQAAILQERGELDRETYQPDTVKSLLLGVLGKLADADATAGQALILIRRGDLDEAMALLREQEEICREWGNNPHGLQNILGIQALILLERGDTDGAVALYKEAEQICRQSGNLEGLQRSLGDQAGILEKRGDWDGAMVLYKEAEQICRQLGNLDALQSRLGDQAGISERRGDLDGAMALYKEAEQMCRQLGNLDALQSRLGDQAGILQSRGDLDGAMVLYKEAERICRQLGDVQRLASLLVAQALALAGGNRAAEGIPLAEEAMQLANSSGFAALAKIIESTTDSIQKSAAASERVAAAEAKALAAAKAAASAEEALVAAEALASADVLCAREATIAAKASAAEALAAQEALESAKAALAAAEALAAASGGPAPPPQTRELTMAELRDFAASALRRGLWEAAETNLQKLIDRGESIETVAPDLITALLNAHAEPLPATVARVQKLISELEKHGHSDLALAARRQLEAKVKPTTKPWWKVW